MGYDPDAEGFPILLIATVPMTSVVWWSTLLNALAYPEEDQITLEGRVFLKQTEVDDDFIDHNVWYETGSHVQ